MSEIEDQLAIIRVCTQMVWHADQREWESLKAVFADQVALDYTSLFGGEPATLTPEQIVEGWTQGLGGFDATQHLITNHLVTVNGDAAVCTASFQATHLLANPLASPLFTLGGTYRLDLVRADGAWKISGLVMTAVWGDGNKDLLTLAPTRSRVTPGLNVNGDANPASPDDRPAPTLRLDRSKA
jgi:hypothetical protein